MHLKRHSTAGMTRQVLGKHEKKNENLRSETIMERKAVTDKIENGLYFNKVYDKQTQLSRHEEPRFVRYIGENK